MSGHRSHFPTFNRAVEVAAGAGMGLASARHRGASGWVELAALRLALYAILALCVVHLAAERVVNIRNGMPSARYGYQGVPVGVGDGLESMVLTFTTWILGFVAAQSTFHLAVLCLVGLAASARASSMRTVAHPVPLIESLEEAILAVNPKAASGPPPRHPLDPEPGDLPPAPRWPKT